MNLFLKGMYKFCLNSKTSLHDKVLEWDGNKNLVGIICLDKCGNYDVVPRDEITDFVRQYLV